ncbi:hypothetical protein GON26_09710 [Flavobacterium sp. GA093]|uniref:Uncharacterized protein n=1 Tax=Flavobacterium hydrocarbonoxydans TaxID=2683249 RepID=A0A6I4NSJ8_9FLAO|nr:hypothetical protein [Flavobacterium hydrocarbonoxydans]MWB94639.1 hypothetical protein [Flavobacterium hydrocarbonoxydans]
MSTVNQHISIPKNVSSNDDMSFDFLRKKGIEYIESLGSRFWTDYNTHDPGITILEVLCYAITDLGMRINLPIEDLLSNNTTPIDEQFFTASEILPTQAVTALDYRKILIDIDPKRIKNCWLQKTSKKLFINCKEAKISLKKEDFDGTLDTFIKESEIKGYYNILVDFDENNIAQKKLLKAKIIEKFHENRNLCEDILEIREVEIQPIAVCALIEIHPEANEEYIHALITLELEKYLSPTIRYYSLDEMFAKGYSSDQIFEGPFLENGFIDTTELENSSLKTEVRLSDIMQIIMNIEGVTVIKDIALNNCEAIDTEGSVWNICIPPNKKPSLCSKSTLNFSKGVLPVTVNKVKAKKYLEDLKEDLAYSQQKAAQNREINIPKGKIVETDFYTSVTNNFPENYGIGEIGLSESAGSERKAKAKQLKGYLLFYDQILASYFKHLSNIKELLSINSELAGTYFTQTISDMTGFDEIVNEKYLSSTEEKRDEFLLGHLDDTIKRQNQIKDHLIARFAERFAEYAFLMKSLYGASSDEIVLQNKSDFLINYDTISSQRGSGFNYFNQPVTNLWNTFNVTGLENRIAGLLGIKGDKNPVTGKRGIKRKNISNLFVQIYDPSPGVDPNLFRWRIRNSANKIILTATEDYVNQSTAIAEMYLSILKIYETTEKEIKHAFEKLLENRDNGIPFKDTVIDTFEVIESDTHKYSFHIINPEFVDDIDNPKRIIARQYKLYPTLEQVQTAMLDLLIFFKEEFSDEGIFLVEHLLLVPDANEAVDESYYMPICLDDCSDDCCIPNPYSFKISVVLPGYTYRFADVDFRNFAENVIRQEIPSHILGKICWIGYRKDHLINKDNDLLDFEKDFKNFLLDKAQKKQNALPKFIKSLSKLNSIYPTGTLYNCIDEEEEISGKIVLGRTNLGTI